ncbi:cation channel family protein (macronuclear) [Tetrahymena thermophila SB210]|uniref:Cation channel family protein n=1 Tax=Tetrahymena thermophila (strain SB210) TaxID=312017 RepID=I7MB04_TETTS|nr:cation channel family protein [Tetrahymena thermophila SB210]EAS07054.2 cation channel family protein [Tetrahymena thermophila SB210]|eukprot:XP_001027296.2 cation channel family protein [Tetrahymena thermophila SB210]
MITSLQKQINAHHFESSKEAPNHNQLSSQTVQSLVASKNYKQQDIVLQTSRALPQNKNDLVLQNHENIESNLQKNAFSSYNNFQSNLLSGREITPAEAQITKNILQQIPYISQTNLAPSQKTFVDQMMESKRKKKPRAMSIYNTIKWKFFASKWFSNTSSSRFKKLNYDHFNLINDKATVISEGSLPNSQQNNSQKIKQKSRIFCFDWNKKQNRDSGDTQEQQDTQTVETNFQNHKFKQIFSQQSLWWCDQWFQCIPVFSPSGKFKFVWDIIILFVIIAFLFMIPLELTFKQSLCTLFNSHFVIFSISVLIADFILAWNFGYFEKGLPITKRSQVVFNYLKNGIVIDVFASIFLVYDILIASHQNWNVLHLLFILKIKSIKVIFKKIEERFHLTPKVMQVSSLFQLLFLILTVSHIFACMWVLVAHYEINIQVKSWIQTDIYYPTDWFGQYVTAYYFATVTMITVGYGDYSPVNNAERLICIASMLISCGVFAYSINAIGEIFSAINKQNKKIKEDLYTISNFMSKKNIERELQYEVREYLEYLWYMQSNREQEKEHQIIDQLNPQLRDKLLFETHKFILQQFKNFSDNFSEEFLVSMIKIMEEQSYRVDEQVMCEINEHECDLFFVESGKFIIYVDENAEKIVKHMQRGDYFGEYAFFSGQAHSYNIKALEYSTVIRLRRKKFLALIQTYPVDYEIFCCIQDKLLYSKEQSILKSQCFSCRSLNHTFQQCPFIHLVVNQIAAINKLSLSEFCDRKDVKRRIQKFPSLLLQQYVFQKYDCFNLENNELIDGYIEQFNEYNELIDEVSELSQNIQRIQSNEAIQLVNIQNQQVNEKEQKNNIYCSPDVRPASLSIGPAHMGSIEEQLKNFTKQFSQTFTKQQSFNNQGNRNLTKEFKSGVNSNLFIASELENTEQIAKAQRQFVRPPALIIPQNTPPSPKQVINSVTTSKASNKDKNNIQNSKNNVQSPLIMSNSSNKQNNLLPVNNSINHMNNNSQLYFYQHNNQEESSKIDNSFMQGSKLKIQNNHSNHIQLNNTHTVNLELNNKQKLNDLIYQIVQTYAQKDYEIQGLSNQEEFEIQKNFDFYLPHNNLSVILEYFKFKQKSIKTMKLSLRNSTHYNKSKLQNTPKQKNSNTCIDNNDQSKYNCSLFMKNILNNPKSHHLFRKFQQQKVKIIESKQRRQAQLIKKRKTNKAVTTKIQKLIQKYEQISNGPVESNLENHSTTQPNQKNTIPETSVVENINDSNNKSQKNQSYYMCKRLSCFSQLAPMCKVESGLDEIKNVQSGENGITNMDQEINLKKQNFLKLPSLQNYIQNKIRFSISSNRKSFQSDTLQSQGKDQDKKQNQEPLNFQEMYKQACINEDISSSSSESENTPRHNMNDIKVFQHNHQIINSSQYIIYSPQNNDSNYSQNQLQPQKQNDNSSYYTQQIRDQSKIHFFKNDY